MAKADISLAYVSGSSSPGSDCDMERVKPIVEVEGEPSTKPQRHGEPLAVYLRHSPASAD